MNIRWPVALLLLLTGTAAAEERILEYHSVIRVAANGELTVTDTITVRAEGKEIRRGIYRDFPTQYRDREGREVRVPLDMVSVRRDGSPEPWHWEWIENGKRFYIGDADVFLSPGVHTYELSYRTYRQVGHFEQFDEIYWNATGNFWTFPIESASAVVRLPEPVPAGQIRFAGYTGPWGARGREYRASVIEPGVVRFETTRELGAREGLTIGVAFPKGVVREPSAMQKRLWFLRDNLGPVLGITGLAATLVWYLVAWLRVGRDPEAGVIYPRYEPPEGYSPASLRYVWRMGFDKTCFATGLVSLAVNGAIRLEKNADDDYVATRTADGANSRSKTEQRLFQKLFKGGDSLVFERGNHSRIGGVIKAHEGALSAAYEGRYFRRNRLWLIPGVLISLLSLAGMLWHMPGEKKFIALFLVAWLAIWSLGAMGLSVAAWRAWRDLGNMLDFGKALITTAFALPFVIAEIAVLAVFGWLVGLLPLLIVAAVIIVNALFYQLLKAPTPSGRKLLDQIEGLRLYMGVAERDDLERIHSEEPPKTLERFEALLPYAVALDTAQTWAEKFEAEISEAERAGELSSRSWYSAASHGGSFSPSRLGTGLASGLSSAVASASTAPGSSSGSGGGGFSGGGGGGGGGGGW